MPFMFLSTSAPVRRRKWICSTSNYHSFCCCSSLIMYCMLPDKRLHEMGDTVYFFLSSGATINNFPVGLEVKWRS